MKNVINWIGIDDHADKWTIAQYRGNEREPAREWELQPSESGYRKLIGWLKELGNVRVVYEAGPCGYELYRRLRRSGIECGVAAPSLTPRKPGDRVKTNRRDARKLGHLLRAGELTLIIVPDARQEAVRDLVRGRQTAQRDLLRARNQLSKLLLRYGHRYRDGEAWTKKHWAWIAKIEISELCSREVMQHMIRTIDSRQALVADYDRSIETIAESAEYKPLIESLGVLRGISRLTALTLLVELGDLQRFGTARQLMAALGLVPGEHRGQDRAPIDYQDGQRSCSSRGGGGGLALPTKHACRTNGAATARWARCKADRDCGTMRSTAAPAFHSVDQSRETVDRCRRGGRSRTGRLHLGDWAGTILNAITLAAMESVEGTGSEGESSSAPTLTRDSVVTHAPRPRQLPTDHVHAVPTRAYQNDHRRRFALDRLHGCTIRRRTRETIS